MRTHGFYSAFFSVLHGMMLLVAAPLLVGVMNAHAQQADSLATLPDSARIRQLVPADTLAPPDSLASVDSAAASAASDTTITPSDSTQTLTGGSGDGPGQQAANLEEGEVRFQAKDSLVFDFRGDRVANLYGSSSVNHNAGKLESGNMQLNLDKNEVQARTSTPGDTLSQPVLTREGQPPVRSDKVAFNYQTEKGRFDVARVEIDRGKITGTKVKNTGRHVVFLEDAIYSTCTLDHPHYYIKMDRAKIVRKEDGNQEIFFKNARLYILDIPYPIVFPFGYFPGNMEQKQSGLLQPTYVFQNTDSRGLGLRNVGWFQYFNDYIVGQLSGDIYTSGSYYIDASTSYRDRNKFNGGLQLGYSRERGLEPTDPNFQTTVNKRLSLNHSQEISPYSSISANINLRTADYFTQNSFEIDERAQTTTNSSLNYKYRHPENTYTFSASVRQNQDFLNNTASLNGPSFDFSLQRFSPFENEATQEDKWYESLSISYDNSFESTFDYRPTAGDSADVNWFQALLSPSKYREATGNEDYIQYGFQQNVRASVGQLLNSQYLNVSTNLNYTEYWYPGSTNYYFNAFTGQVEEDQVNGFITAREFNTSLNFSTTFYGISNAKIGTIEGFRHTVRPNISFSYSPDFSSPFFGYFQEVPTDLDGNSRQFSIFQNEVFNGPTAGEQRSINFGVNNVFEAKQVKRDSTGEKSEQVLRLIDQLSLNSSYNFAADSLKLASLSSSISSSVVEGVNFRASANFNFYQRNEQGLRINKYLLQDGGVAELTNFSASASTQFDGGPGGNGFRVNHDPHFPAQYDPYNQSIFRQMDPNFNMQPVKRSASPWSFSLNFNYNWNLVPNGDNNKSATINAQNIQFRLTPKWQFQTQIGYDFIRRELTPSQFNLSRQLHEWTLSFQMNPFGDFQYYFFRLSINSSQIQSIFQKLPLLRNLERSNSPTGRGPGSYGRF